ncbi:hypothetical protein [Actinomadura harenae]|uniref:Uncharacterized protein n=1 Tax=Actinomadura harenae TaxID=2483351 RepID=A0A3M2LKZ3_9ACTN|nr:hypothetical protein [Actinomadura harenae]RMI38061.1 hypothetical protein EBO15_34095 [Actinomadura harenae]
MGEYTYTTIAIEPGQSPRISVSLLGNDSLRVLTCTSAENAAQVSVTQGEVHVSITPIDNSAVTAADVRSARELAGAFAAYAVRVEQLHQQHTVSSSGDSSGSDGSECGA